MTTTKAKPCPLAGDSEAAQHARAAVERMMRAHGDRHRIPKTKNTADRAEACRAWLVDRPDLAAHLIHCLARQSARAWERGNNSGSDAIMTDCNAQHVLKGAAVELLAACFNLTTDWTGLYPTFQNTVTGWNYYPDNVAGYHRALLGV